MVYSSDKEKLIGREGESLVYGINRGKYPLHLFINNPLTLNKEMPLGPLTVSVAGDDEWVKDCLRRRLNSNLTSFELVEEGEMIFRSQRGTFHVQPGQLFIVHFHEDSEMTTESAFVRKKTIILPGSLSAQVVNHAGLENIDVIDLQANREIVECFTEVIHELREQQPDFNLRASEAAFRLILRLGRKARAPEYPLLLTRTVEFICTHVGRNLTLQEICDFAGTTPGTLNNLFKKYFHLSPIDYALRHKIKVAETMLLNQHRYIKEIAAELGYANQFYFSLDFKKRTGISPSEYRKQNSTV